MGLFDRLFRSNRGGSATLPRQLPTDGGGTVSAGAAGGLDAILILFNRDFGPKDQIIDSILSRMVARGQPYRRSMTARTKVSSLTVSDPQNPARYMSTAMVQFRMMLGSQADLKKVEVANFQGSDGVFGVIMSHWS